MRRPKKSETLEVRLPHETKQAFMARCRAEERSASEIIREAIEEYLTRPPRAPALKRQRLRTLQSASLPFAAVLLGAANFGVVAGPPSGAAAELTPGIEQSETEAVTLARRTPPTLLAVASLVR